MKPPASGGSSRPAAVAGQFYPAEPAPLRAMIARCLEAVAPWTGPSPKALIAPHAGYIYSGPVAASAFASFVPDRSRIKRIVLLGPAHRVSFPGLATSSAHAWATPLGLVPLDPAALALLGDLPQVRNHDPAHRWEHSLEVQVPFLQSVLEGFQLIPLLVGEASDTEIRQVLDCLWGGPETRLVISSDLSHYHDYETAVRLDRRACQAIESLQPLEPEQACGCRPIGGLLAAARARRLHVRTLDLRNSGDTAGSRDRVVGYGAWAFWEPLSKEPGA